MNYRPGMVSILVCAALTRLPATAAAQEFCVIPPDSSWRPVDFGYEADFSTRIVSGRVVARAYPVVRKVKIGSAADSAGMRDGDTLVAINGFDVISRRDSTRTIGPGVPTRLTIRRGDSTFQRTLVGLPAKPCGNGRRPEA